MDNEARPLEAGAVCTHQSYARMPEKSPSTEKRCAKRGGSVFERLHCRLECAQQKRSSSRGRPSSPSCVFGGDVDVMSGVGHHSSHQAATQIVATDLHREQQTGSIRSAERDGNNRHGHLFWGR
jgi:hypothetical protein